jgi:hypothetical protein
LKYTEYNNYCRLSYLIAQRSADKDMLAAKGYDQLSGRHKAPFPLMTDEGKDDELILDSTNFYYLDKIRKLCRDHDINYICYTAPIYRPFYMKNVPRKLKDAMNNYISKTRITYLNYTLDQRYTSDSLFYDETHLNSEGTDLFTAQFASDTYRYIKSRSASDGIAFAHRSSHE